MAESDLDIRIKVPQNEALDAAEEIKKAFDDAAKSAESLADAPTGDLLQFVEQLKQGLTDFVNQAGTTTEGVAGFLQGMVEQFSEAADAIRALAPDKAEFLEGIVDALEEISGDLEGVEGAAVQADQGVSDLGDQFVIAGQKAQKAGDQFTLATAAANPTADELAKAGQIGGARASAAPATGPSTAEFTALQESLQKTGVDFDVLSAKKDSFRGNLTGLNADLRRADAAVAEFNRALISSAESLAAQKLHEFNQAVFAVDVALAAGVAELERYSIAFQQLISSVNPAIGAEAKLAEQTKVLDFALKQGWIQLEQYNAALRKLTANAAAASKQTTGLAGFFNGLKSAILGTALGFTSAQVAIQLFQKAMEVATQAIKDAAETQQLNTALAALAASTNVSTEAIHKQVKALEDLGFAGSAARRTVVKMIQSELDVADATKLGEAARNQAIVSGKKESDVLETLVNGIANRNARALRSIGLTINQAEAENKYALSLQKTADQLTLSEKQAAIMAAALEQIGKAAGAAEKGQDDFNVVMSRFEVQFAETAEKAGTAFLPLLTALVRLASAATDFITALLGFEGVSEAIDIFILGLTTIAKFLGFLFEISSIGWSFISDEATEAAITIKEVWNAMLLALGFRTKETFQEIAKEIEAQRVKLAEKKNKTRAASDAFRARIRGEEGGPGAVDAATTIPKMPKPEDIRASLNALIGPQVKEGFSNLSKSGQEAVDNLRRVFHDFASESGPQVVKSAEKVKQSLVAAFAAQKTAQDFIHFLSLALDIAQDLGVNLRFIEEEAAFRQQADTLKEMNALMTGYIDAAKQLLAIQTLYNTLILDGVENEAAMQQTIALVTDDRAKQLAIEMQLNAQRLEASKRTFATAEADSTALFNRRVAEAKALGLSEEETARRIAVADKELTKQRLQNSQNYYTDLQTKTKAAIASAQAAALELKKLQEDSGKRAREGQQTLRDIERRQRGKGFTERDTRDEVAERQAAVTQALAANNLTRAKEEIEKLKALASQIESEGGEGATRQRQEAFDITKQTIALQEMVDAKELGFAAQKLKDEEANKDNLLNQLAIAKELVNTLATKVTADLVVKVDPVALESAKNEIAGALNAPVPLGVVAAPAALENFATQVQEFLDKQQFTVPLSVRSSGSAPQKAHGGIIGGHSPTSTSDNLLAWLTAGEFVQPVAAVQHYGTAFMESIRRMQFPRFAAGGEVGGEGAGGAMTTLAININGQPAGKVMGTRAQVRNIVSAFKQVSLGT